MAIWVKCRLHRSNVYTNLIFSIDLELGSWKHQSDIPFEDLELMFMVCPEISFSLLPQTLTVTQVLWLMQWSLSFVHGTMNISVLTFYLRVFQDQSLRFRRLIYAFIFFTATASTAVVLTIIFQCSPANSYWRSDTRFANHDCMDSEKLLYTQSGLILFCDIALFIMPMKYLWGMCPLCCLGKIRELIGLKSSIFRNGIEYKLCFLLGWVPCKFSTSPLSFKQLLTKEPPERVSLLSFELSHSTNFKSPPTELVNTQIPSPPL